MSTPQYYYVFGTPRNLKKRFVDRPSSNLAARSFFPKMSAGTVAVVVRNIQVIRSLRPLLMLKMVCYKSPFLINLFQQDFLTNAFL